MTAATAAAAERRNEIGILIEVSRQAAAAATHMAEEPDLPTDSDRYSFAIVAATILNDGDTSTLHPTVVCEAIRFVIASGYSPDCPPL